MELNIEDLAVILNALGVAMENEGEAEAYGEYERLYTAIGAVVDAAH